MCLSGDVVDHLLNELGHLNVSMFLHGCFDVGATHLDEMHGLTLVRFLNDSGCNFRQNVPALQKRHERTAVTNLKCNRGSGKRAWEIGVGENIAGSFQWEKL
jgi:hypothetical protein